MTSIVFDVVRVKVHRDCDMDAERGHDSNPGRQYSIFNAQAALGALPRVVEIMAEDLDWSHSRRQAEIDRATESLASMGLPPGIER